jgi:hypothetical protein
MARGRQCGAPAGRSVRRSSRVPRSATQRARGRPAKALTPAARAQPSTLVKTPQREAFACQLDAARPQVNHNALLVDEFVKLEKLASASGEPRYKYRALQYARQANILRQLDFPVKSSEDVRGMRYMGESCRAKIAEILETRSLRKREFMEHDERNEALRALTSVWGIGNATAQGLLAKGIRSLAMLERAAARGEVVLDERQQAGLRHHADLSERIDSAEVKALGRVVQEAVRGFAAVARRCADVCGAPGPARVPRCEGPRGGDRGLVSARGQVLGRGGRHSDGPEAGPRAPLGADCE